MKRFLAAFLTLAILLTGLTLTASAATTGWVKDGDYWTYVKADGKLAENEWIQDGGKWYYFSGTMMAADGLWQINEQWYAFNEGGAMVANGWYGQKWEGERDDGTKVTGKDWYYANADGSLVRGWKKIGGNWYYFNDLYEDSTPWMATGWWEIDNTNYAFKGSGEMIVGWGQPWIDNPWNTEPDTDWVYANADGSLVEGWKKIDGKWYYFAPWMFRDMITGFKDGEPWNWGEDSVYYAFNKSGAMIENSWYKEEYTWEDEEGNTGTGFDWYYLGKDGAAVKGWIKDGGKWYYMDPKYAYMWNWGFASMSDGNTYYFDKDSGEMKTGWVQDGDCSYFFKDSGAMAKEEWIKSDGSWYYMKEYGEMAADETLTIDGQEYKFGKDGAWINE